MLKEGNEENDERERERQEEKDSGEWQAVMELRDFLVCSCYKRFVPALNPGG